MIPHGRVRAAIKASPLDEVGCRSGIAIPLAVFQKFLPHKNLWDSRRRQKKAGGEARAAARVPGAWVGAVGESGKARVAAHRHQVVVLDASNCLPPMGKALGI